MVYLETQLPYGFRIKRLEQEQFIQAPDGTLFPYRSLGGRALECQVDLLKWRIVPEGWKMFRSPSGEFLCDENGYLKGFYPAEGNDISLKNDLGATIRRIYQHLIIPEGIREIGQAFLAPDAVWWFRDLTVVEQLRFPASLRRIGDCCFANGSFHTVEFPARLEKLDAFVFGGSKIQKLIIPDKMKTVVICYDGAVDPERNPPDGVLWIVGRDFKEAWIEELICPEEFEVYPLMPEARIGKRSAL